MQLVELPTELVENITDSLHYSATRNLSLTCRRFRNLLEGNLWTQIRCLLAEPPQADASEAFDGPTMSIPDFVSTLASSKTSSLVKKIQLVGRADGKASYTDLIRTLLRCHNLEALEDKPGFSYISPMFLMRCDLVHTMPMLSSLRRLDIPFYCIACSDLSKLPHLRSLKLNDVDLFGGPVKNLSSLEQLHLVFCRNYVTTSILLIDWLSLPKLEGLILDGDFVQIPHVAFQGEPKVLRTLSFRGKVRPMRPYSRFFSSISATIEKLSVASRLPPDHCHICFARLRVLDCCDYIDHPFRGAVFPVLKSLKIHSVSAFIRPIHDFRLEILRTVVTLNVRQGQFGSIPPPLQTRDTKTLKNARHLRHLIIAGYHIHHSALALLEDLPLETAKFNESIPRADSA